MPRTERNAHAIAGTITRLNAPDYDRWAAQIRRTGGCCQPIHLRGRVDHRHATTGALLRRYTTRTEPDGVLRLPCKTRRASRCAACAETYRADTYHLIRAGLIGGKGVPTSVSTHPCLFVTLTAPSFGAVHARRQMNGKPRPCHPRRDAETCPHDTVMSCTIKHHPDDGRLGEPLCPSCYDYTGSVLFNALASTLWKRFADSLRWHLAHGHALTIKAMRDELVVSFAKVAEYQRRGVIHLHALIRLDGPDGPSTPPPMWATADALAEAVRAAARAVHVASPSSPDQTSRLLGWGDQLDIRPVTLAGELTEQAVAGYVAKYATKAAECVGTLDRPIRITDDLDALPVSTHARRLIAECLRLAYLDGLADLRLGQWAHMLGYRGHFSTRSRLFSLTLGDIRAARERFVHTEECTREHLMGIPEDDVVKVADWHYVGRGFTAADALVSASLVGSRARRGAR
ncbi:replication initiator [Herbidospora cretacea]|uniref:replication initiator n=1 Tax=Herbidospora cretacea TaxID=28444 RepID=UPI000773CB0A|nr:replication initiator [Herbidospora cretacea]